MRTILHYSFLLAALLFAAAFVKPAMAQGTGLLVSDERYAQVPMLPAYSGQKYNDIPVKVSLKKYCPVPGDQGQTGTCVGWAVGYGALTIQRAVEANLTDRAAITQMANSSAYIYNSLRQKGSDCSEGIFLEESLALLKEKGDCLEKTYRFDNHACAGKPSENIDREAAQYRIRDYAALFIPDEDPKGKVGKMCKVLATKTPVVVGMGVTKSFFDLLPGTATWQPIAAEETANYHAMVVVGYNSVDKYFDLLNSFGASWGQNGYVRISFDDFARLCRYAYVLLVDENKPLKISEIQGGRQEEKPSQLALSGEFVFRRPAGFVIASSGDELMYFEEVATQVESGHLGYYVTRQAAFRAGDVFQLVVRDVPKGCYAYVFSKSPDGTVNHHFPRKKENYASAGFIIDKSAEIVVPGEDRLLQLPSPGYDYLCILYAKNKISDYELRLKQLQDANSDFAGQVSAVFSDLLIAPDKVLYSTDKMAFSALVEPAIGKTAVLTVLKVKAE